MKTSRTVIVGTVLISSVLVLILTTFFVSQDSCSQGTFMCGNSTYCIPQKSMCNGYRDCPNGEDESGKNCADFFGSEFAKSLLMGVQKPTSNYHSCGLANVPRACVCRNKTYLYCKNVGLTQVPAGISDNVTRLILANNTINNLTENAFADYPNLHLIHLEGNQIKFLPPKIFQQQTTLVKLLLMNNHLKNLPESVFERTVNLSILFLQNNLLTDSDLKAFENAISLQYLDLSKNCIQLKMRSFPSLLQLRELLLEENQVEEISDEVFSNLPKLQFLSLRQNRIAFIHKDAFTHMGDLRELDLSHNGLRTLTEDVFSNLLHLSKLIIGHNPFHYVPSRLFLGLHNLSSLNLEEIELSNIDIQMFAAMKKLNFIYMKNFYYCTFAPMVPKCEPKSDGVSTDENLLGRPILRITVWIVAFVTCTGNIYVFWGRVTTRDENKVLNWIIRNLAVSDLAMGLYLIVIGAKDIQYRGVYHRVSHEWISSWTCTLIGSIAMLSSEVSIFILVFMSFERFLLIAVPFGGHQNLTLKTSCYGLGVIWTFGLCLALIPVIHWRNSTRFYGANAMCFPLHIDDPYFAGWQFSAFVFIGINLTGILTIAFLYSGMFWSIWKTRHATTLNVGDFEFAIRFFFIVLTNTACWAPVIILKIVALFRIYIPADVYSWVSVFIIPVNSAFNPLLYTLTTPKYREVIKYTITRRMQPFAVSKHQTSNADTISHTSSNRNAVGFCTVSVLLGASKTNSVDLPTFNTSMDRTSSTGCDDFCTSSQSTGQGSRGNSFDLPSATFDHSSDQFFYKEIRYLSHPPVDALSHFNCISGFKGELVGEEPGEANKYKDEATNPRFGPTTVSNGEANQGENC